MISLTTQKIRRATRNGFKFDINQIIRKRLTPDDLSNRAGAFSLAEKTTADKITQAFDHIVKSARALY